MNTKTLQHSDAGEEFFSDRWIREDVEKQSDTRKGECLPVICNDDHYQPQPGQATEAMVSNYQSKVCEKPLITAADRSKSFYDQADSFHSHWRLATAIQRDFSRSDCNSVCS